MAGNWAQKEEPSGNSHSVTMQKGLDFKEQLSFHYQDIFKESWLGFLVLFSTFAMSMQLHRIQRGFVGRMCGKASAA